MFTLIPNESIVILMLQLRISPVIILSELPWRIIKHPPKMFNQAHYLLSGPGFGIQEATP